MKYRISFSLLLILLLAFVGCTKKSTEPPPSAPPIKLLSISPTQGPPGTQVEGSTDLDSVGIKGVHIRIGELDVPIISSSGKDFSFMIPILSSGSAEVALKDTTGRVSNALIFTVTAPQPTGFPPGQIAEECHEVMEQLPPVLQAFAAVLESTGYISPAETLSMAQDIQTISQILNAIKQEISALPDSEKTIMDGILKESGLSDLFGVTGSSGGLKKSISDLRKLLKTEDEYEVFYALVRADNISFILSAIKAQLTVASFVAVLSGLGSGVGLILTGLNVFIGAVDAMFDGFWPTDLYKMDVKFVPNTGPTLEVGETAKGDFQGYFKTQSNPTSATIGVITQGTLSAISAAIPKTTIEEIAAKIAIKAGVSASQALTPTEPLSWPGTVPVDMRYYNKSISDILGLYIAPYMGAGFTTYGLLQILEAAGVEIFSGSVNPVLVNTNMATYDINSSTLTANIQGTVYASDLKMQAWVIGPICTGEENWWWTWICLGIEAPQFLKDTAFKAQGITIYPAPDIISPATVTSLATSNPTSNSIRLTWTAPGDDGNSGTASQYDIRYSTSTITSSNWNSASQSYGEPTPKSAGSSESFVVIGLSPNTTYYFGMKTADEVPNWSGLSNVVSGKTSPLSDVSPPASITNLATSDPTSSSIRLTWTAPGDDGNSGTASQYDIRYSTSNITSSNWNSATQCSGESTPKSAGSSESFVVTGLSPNTTYYFAIKTADEVPNWSGLSNVDSERTSVKTVYHAAMYCESGDFNFDNHTDEFVLDYYLTCWHGSEFDANVSKYTDDDIDIIFIGGDNTFSSSTASSIENVVYNAGKILVINFWSNRKFDACLPAANAGDAPYGDYLEVVDPENPIFDGLPSTYVRNGPNWNREHAIERAGSIVLIRFDNGDPALLYWKYGNGYVIEWTLECMGAFNFQNQELDTIIYRTIKHCLSLRSVP